MGRAGVNGAMLCMTAAVLAFLGIHWYSSETIFRIPKGETPTLIFDIPKANKKPG